VGIVLANNATSLLASDITDAAVTLSVTSGEGALFPNPDPGDYFYATLLDSDGNMEIVKVTARTVDVFTIVRAQEGTLAVAFATGARVEHRITAQTVLDTVDAAVAAVTLADFGITASAAELNRMDGVTASASEINILDGLTASTSELNILDGVTVGASDINKLNGLTSSTAELNILTGVTATASDLNKLTGVTASAAELNKLSGVTATTSEINKLAGLTASTAELNKLTGATPSTTEINYLTGVTSNIQTQINAFATFPPGVTLPYAGSSAPSGWVLCDGQALNRVTYAALFAIISTTFGAGNGSTTFNVPDLRGRVVAGKDDMGGVAANRLTGTSGGVDGDTLGASGGAETHVVTTAEMPAHTHSLTYGRKDVNGGGGTDPSYLERTGYTKTTASAGSGAAHNNVQPTLIMNYIIKT
jgi:microcystin-dependent protein